LSRHFELLLISVGVNLSWQPHGEMLIVAGMIASNRAQVASNLLCGAGVSPAGEGETAAPQTVNVKALQQLTKSPLAFDAGPPEPPALPLARRAESTPPFVSLCIEKPV